jgi:hypothetical protein
MTGRAVAFVGAQHGWPRLLDPDGAGRRPRAGAARRRDSPLRGAALSRADDGIHRDARLCCAADEFQATEIRGVVVHGRAEPSGAGDGLGVDWLEYTLPLDDVASFDFRKIRSTEEKT